MTTLLTPTGTREHPASGPSATLRSPVEPSPSDVPASPIRDRAGSSFTALTRSIHEMGLMRRRYGYYWTKLISAVLILAAWVVGFILIGDSWWQLANAGLLAVLMTQIAFLGHDAAHRQIFKSGRWNDWVSLIIANLLVGMSLRLAAEQTQPPPRQPEQGRSRPRHRVDCDRHDARTSDPAP
jgi:hypothetical protein